MTCTLPCSSDRLDPTVELGEERIAELQWNVEPDPLPIIFSSKDKRW
jgi:hypothetical protein